MDCIQITGLKVETTIGVYHYEQQIKQPLWLDISCFLPLSGAGRQDDLGQSLDYASLTQKIRQTLKDKKFQLIETVAETIAQLVLDDDKVEKVTISVSKPQALGQCRDVRVSISRER